MGKKRKEKKEKINYFKQCDFLWLFARVFLNPKPDRPQYSRTPSLQRSGHLCPNHLIFLESWIQNHCDSPGLEVKNPITNLISILLPSGKWLLIRRGAFPFHQVLHLALWRDPACQNLVFFTACEPPRCAEVTGDRRLEVWEGRVVFAQAFKGVAVDGTAHDVPGLGDRRTRWTQLALYRLPLTGQSTVVGWRKLPLPTAHVLSVHEEMETD